MGVADTLEQSGWQNLVGTCPHYHMHALYCRHGEMGTCPHQVLTFTLTLFQSGARPQGGGLCPLYTDVSAKGSMISLLMHNVAHSPRHSFRPKTNNQPIKKFLSLAFSCVKVVKLDVILENKVVQKLKFSKNVNNKRCHILRWKFFLERFG